jgi:glyoxylase-like metal-dependent hydrolase (beta-lactamase superfamily II)
MTTPLPLSRRDFIGRASSCAAHIGLMAAASPPFLRMGWLAQERFPVVVSEPWARIVRVGDGIWAVVSTPLEDRTTLCNGGIIAGRNGVAVIESFSTVQGAEWVMEQARRLTGRFATHVILTHFHADHTGGLAGSASSADADILATERTRDLIREKIDDAPAAVLDDVEILVGRRPTELDLGDRSVILVPRRGHTESDLSIELPEDSVVFCGDLVWNAMFPNYVDAIPSRLSQEVRIMRLLGTTTFVPGHGPLADTAAIDRYITLLDSVEQAARAALEGGTSADEAGAAYKLPSGMEGWTLFSPSYFARAIGAWMRELQA